MRQSIDCRMDGLPLGIPSRYSVYCDWNRKTRYPMRRRQQISNNDNKWPDRHCMKFNRFVRHTVFRPSKRFGSLIEWIIREYKITSGERRNWSHEIQSESSRFVSSVVDGGLFATNCIFISQKWCRVAVAVASGAIKETKSMWRGSGGCKRGKLAWSKHSAARTWKKFYSQNTNKDEFPKRPQTKYVYLFAISRRFVRECQTWHGYCRRAKLCVP